MIPVQIRSKRHLTDLSMALENIQYWIVYMYIYVYMAYAMAYTVPCMVYHDNTVYIHRYQWLSRDINQCHTADIFRATDICSSIQSYSHCGVAPVHVVSISELILCLPVLSPATFKIGSCKPSYKWQQAADSCAHSRSEADIWVSLT